MAVNPRHIGRSAYPDIQTIADVGRPPQPLPPHVAIVDREGKPTQDYYQWHMKLHDWRMKLYAFLGGAV